MNGFGDRHSTIELHPYGCKYTTFFIKRQYLLRKSYTILGDFMAIIKYTTKEKELLARIMRAEAVGEGNLRMLMVGNVVVNRGLADCLTFKNVTTISDVI